MKHSPGTTRDLALVGAGYWGKNLARNFHALGSLHTICDPSPSVLSSYGPDYAEVAKISSFEEVLKEPAVTKIAIAAPAAFHYKLAKAAIMAGKDVYIEKPLCLNIADAEELVRLSDSCSRILMVGHLLQYHPCILKLKELIAHGKLGRLQYITSNRLNLGKIRQEENALWSFAPHDISVILSLVSDALPEQVRCIGGSYLSPQVADTTVTTMRFAGQIRAHIYVSWLNPFKEQKLTVVGSEGMAVFDDTKNWAEKLVVYEDYLTWADGRTPSPRKGTALAIAVTESEPLYAECSHFLDCCRERRSPRTDGAEGWRVLQVLRAAQVSLDRDGEAITPANSVSAKYYAHPSAEIDNNVSIGDGTKIWHFSHIMSHAHIGVSCNVGQNVVIAGGVTVGNNVKIQNNVSVYTGTVIEDDVFLGPSCVLTNVSNPRSQITRHALYEKTIIKRGATIGANATIVCGITIGRYAFIAAGAVVTRDVPDYALMLGNPARQRGWMSRHGHRMRVNESGEMICPESGFRYKEVHPGVVRCIDVSEDRDLDRALTVGRHSYREFKVKSDAANQTIAR